MAAKREQPILPAIPGLGRKVLEQPIVAILGRKMLEQPILPAIPGLGRKMLQEQVCAQQLGAGCQCTDCQWVANAMCNVQCLQQGCAHSLCVGLARLSHCCKRYEAAICWPAVSPRARVQQLLEAAGQELLTDTSRLFATTPITATGPSERCPGLCCPGARVLARDCCSAHNHIYASPRCELAWTRASSQAVDHIIHEP